MPAAALETPVPVARFPRALALFTLANALAVSGGLAVVTAALVGFGLLPRYAAATGAGSARDLLAGRQGTDSWEPMLEAVRAWQSGLPVYQTVFFERKVKFQYPPASLVPLAALRRLGVTEEAIMGAAKAAAWAAVWLTIALAAAIVARTRPRSDLPWIAVAALAAGLSFQPLTRAFQLGQVQTFLNFEFALALWFWLRGRERSAGALVGLMTLVKPQYGLFALWFAARRRFGALAAALAVAAAGGAAGLAVFGWREHARYLDVLSYIGKRGESFYANLSVNGLLHRLLFNGPNLEWDAHAYAPYHPWVYVGTLATSLLAIGWALRSPGPKVRAGAGDFAAFVIAATVASPVAWDHHHGILFAAFALLAAPCLAERRAWTAAAFVLAANAWTPFNALAAVPLANALQTVALAGAATAFVLLRRTPSINP